MFDSGLEKRCFRVVSFEFRALPAWIVQYPMDTVISSHTRHELLIFLCKSGRKLNLVSARPDICPVYLAAESSGAESAASLNFTSQRVSAPFYREKGPVI